MKNKPETAKIFEQMVPCISTSINKNYMTGLNSNRCLNKEHSPCKTSAKIGFLKVVSGAFCEFNCTFFAIQQHDTLTYIWWIRIQMKNFLFMQLIAMKYSCKDTEQWGLESRRMKVFPKFRPSCSLE